MKNKKAQFGGTLSLIIAVIIIVILLFFFIWAIDNIVKIKNFFGVNTIALKLQEDDVSFYSLQSYLHSKVEIGQDGSKQNVSISDLVRLWNIYNSLEYKEILEDESQKILSGFASEDGTLCYYLEIENYITKSPAFQYARGPIPESLNPVRIGDSYLSSSKDKEIIEIPVFGDKRASVSLTINSLCIK